MALHKTPNLALVPPDRKVGAADIEPSVTRHTHEWT